LLAVAVLAAALWAAHVGKTGSREEAAHHYGSTEASRRMEYYYQLGATPAAAKEVRVFGLGRFLAERFTSTWGRSMTGVITPLPVRVLTATAALCSAVLGGLAWIAWAAAGGWITPGLAAVYIQALMLSLIAMQQSSWTGLQTELAMATLRRFDEAVAVVPTARPDTPAPATAVVYDLPRRDIRFEGVSFRYPGGTGEVLSGLDLVIPAGTSLAVVGANGAGKTTLVKLLCRLYEPLAGRITVDGVDLAGLYLARARELAQVTGSARQRRRIRDLAKRIGTAA
jgi:ATP-binding cassette, subfamily B, bacterial